MAQMGHTSSALEVYAKKMARTRDTGERMDALPRGADWGVESPEVSAQTVTRPVRRLSPSKQKAPLSRAFGGSKGRI
jgi:hypothetical protein